VACIATKSERRFGLRFTAKPVLAKRRCVISITDAGEMPVYSHSPEKQCWTGMGRMLSRFWHWLEYDPVALAVLLIGVGSIALLVLGI